MGFAEISKKNNKIEYECLMKCMQDFHKKMFYEKFGLKSNEIPEGIPLEISKKISRGRFEKNPWWNSGKILLTKVL